MTSIVVNTGLQRIGVSASGATGTGVTYSSARLIQTMSWDDLAAAFAAGHDQLSDAGAVSNEYDQAFDSTPARTNQTVAHVSTIPTGQGNFTIRRVALHDDTAANVSTSSATLVAGIDGQALTKDSNFTLATTINLTYSSI